MRSYLLDVLLAHTHTHTQRGARAFSICHFYFRKFMLSFVISHEAIVCLSLCDFIHVYIHMMLSITKAIVRMAIRERKRPSLNQWQQVEMINLCWPWALNHTGRIWGVYQSESGTSIHSFTHSLDVLVNSYFALSLSFYSHHWYRSHFEQCVKFRRRSFKKLWKPCVQSRSRPFPKSVFRVCASLCRIECFWF